MNAMEESPMVKKFREVKSRYPDTILLFRCGGLYEAYDHDAFVVSKVLGITLKDSNGMRIAEFPNHALDTYLPMLIRAGRRVAINDGLISTNNNFTPTTMRLNISKKESVNAAVKQQVNNPEETAIVSAALAPSAIEAEAVVVSDEPKPKRKAPKAPKAPKAKKAPKDVEPDPDAVGELVYDEPQLPKVKFGEYTTKRGDKAPQIVGFAGEEDARWSRNKGKKCVSAGFRRDINGEKVYTLIFGVRYMQVAKDLADAYNTSDVNAWQRAEDAVNFVYEQAQKEGKERWEQKKAEWAAAKAQNDASKKQKMYTPEQVAQLFNDVLSGKKLPDEIDKLVKVA